MNPEDVLPDSSQLSRFRNHRLVAAHVEEVLKAVVRQCIDKGLIKSKTLLMDSTHTFADAAKEKPLQVLQNAAKRLYRVVVKKHPKLENKLPKQPALPEERAEAEKAMLHYLAELGETVESLLPDHEGTLSEKIKIAKQIVEDERFLALKGVLSAIDPDTRFGWKSSTKSFFGYKEHIAMTEEEIITAIEVTSGTADDGKQLKTLLEQSKRGIDITYCGTPSGFIYLVAIIDWYSRFIVGWASDFVVRVVQEAVQAHGTPEIFNSDQGSQFTSVDYINCIKSYETIERFFRSYKWERLACNSLKRFGNSSK